LTSELFPDVRRSGNGDRPRRDEVPAKRGEPCEFSELRSVSLGFEFVENVANGPVEDTVILVEQDRCGAERGGAA